MKRAKISFKINNKTTQNNKFFNYKGKSYPFNFDLFKKNSKYFFANRQALKNKDSIDLISEIDQKSINFSDDDINNFIKCCQEESIDIDLSNVIQLQFLANKYDVPQLINITTDFIAENSKELVIKSLLFKSQIQRVDDTYSNFTNTTNEELIISSNLNKYIEEKEDDLASLPIPVLERIFTKFCFQSNSQQLFKNSEQITNFLFTCLDKQGKDASILFSFFNFENHEIDVVNRLLNEYSDVFDFNMINSTLLKTTSELTSELTKLKLEYSEALKEMKNLFEKQRKELNKITEIHTKKIEKDDIKRQEREKEFKAELKNMREETMKQKNAFKTTLQEMEEKQEEVIQSGAITKYFNVIKELVDKHNFKKLKDESKKFVISEIIQDQLDSKSDEKDIKGDLEHQIYLLKKLLDSIQEKNKTAKIQSISAITGSKKKKVNFIMNNIYS